MAHVYELTSFFESMSLIYIRKVARTEFEVSKLEKKEEAFDGNFFPCRRRLNFKVFMGLHYTHPRTSYGIYTRLYILTIY